MKLKILFIQGGIGISGISKSLINLLQNINYDKYNVDLFLLNPNGILINYIPPKVNIITNHIVTEYLNNFNGLKYFIKNREFKYFIYSLIRMLLSFINRSWGALYIAKLMSPIQSKYDAIIDWQGQQQLYYMVNKLNAKRKITFFHSDYKKWS